MKKRIAAICLSTVLAAASLLGCGGTSGTSTNTAATGKDPDSQETASATQGSSADTSASSKSDLLSKIKEKGKLTIAMEGTWAPWTYHDEADALVGYDVEVGQNVAKALGVEAEFVEGEWDGLFPGLDAGLYDILINGVDATPERNEKYDFSTPYAYIHTVLVVRSDNDDIKSFDDLKGKTTANSIGSTYMEMGEQFGARVEGVDSLGETMQMVLSGRADATINAEVSVLDYLKEQPNAAIKIVDSTKEAGEVVIPLRKGAETASLRAAIDEAIAGMKADGTLKALSEKYFGSDITNP